MEVHLVQGGLPSPVRFNVKACYQLPPVTCCNADFSNLVDPQGVPIDASYRQQRAEQLLQITAAIQPDLLLIELFPFGRRQFRFELLPLLEQARSQGIPTACSLRDILVQKSTPHPKREEETVAYVEQYFNRVLVHSDPSLVTLEQSCPFTHRIRHKLSYTGYVADSGSSPSTPRPREGVVVSAGGGAVGYPLLEAIVQCKGETSLANQPWTLITGPGLDDVRFSRLQQVALKAGIVVERFRDDFVSLLAKSSLSISQAGYNTTMEVLATATPALVIPYGEGGETEQRQRSEILQRKGLIQWLPADSLRPEILAPAIDRAAQQSPPPLSIDLSGAHTTARLLQDMLQEVGP
ncbi:glycosyltransferase family protein [Aestuariirhabdus litorea]|nr:glycosyltransferase [Aestuariirhabdus litorea]